MDESKSPHSVTELLEYMPPCVEHLDKTYCLHIWKGASGYIVAYSHTEDKIHVDLQGVKFTKKTDLFDTFRMDKDLSKALSKMISLLTDNKKELKFIPRIHPLNQ